MDTTDLLWTSVAMREAVARDEAGMVIRLARRAADLNQTALGRRCGYSASTISRIERVSPLYTTSTCMTCQRMIATMVVEREPPTSTS